MAVATWQKSTARRFVSVFAVREITNRWYAGWVGLSLPSRELFPLGPANVTR